MKKIIHCMFLLLVLHTQYSCNATRTTMVKKAHEIRINYGYAVGFKDTCLHSGKYDLCYKNGVLIAASEKQANKGFTFIFIDSLQFKYAIKTSKNSSDTIIRPVVFINESW